MREGFGTVVRTQYVLLLPHYNYHHRLWYRSLLLPILLGYNQLYYDTTEAYYCYYYYYH